MLGAASAVRTEAPRGDAVLRKRPRPAACCPGGGLARAAGLGSGGAGETQRTQETRGDGALGLAAAGKELTAGWMLLSPLPLRDTKGGAQTPPRPCGTITGADEARPLRGL